MAYYLVKARPVEDLLPALKKRIDEGEILQLKPFGQALHESLENARLSKDGLVSWEEEDHGDPPLQEERRELLDQFFTELTASKVEKGEGWKRIEALPLLWDEWEEPEIDV